jgi:hypothetical protein
MEVEAMPAHQIGAPPKSTPSNAGRVATIVRGPATVAHAITHIQGGEWYFSIPELLRGLLFLVASWLFSMLDDGSSGVVIPLVFWIYLGCAVLLRVQIAARRSSDHEMAMSPGISRFEGLFAQAREAWISPPLLIERLLTPQSWFVIRWFEPAFFLALAWLMSMLGDPDGAKFLLILGVGAFWSANAIYINERHVLVSVRDAEIRQQAISQRRQEEQLGDAHAIQEFAVSRVFDATSSTVPVDPDPEQSKLERMKWVASQVLAPRQAHPAPVQSLPLPTPIRPAFPQRASLDTDGHSRQENA